MGYDLEFIQAAPAGGAKFPVQGEDAKALRKKADAFDAAQTRGALLGLPGSKEGPAKAVDFVGKGLNYARFEIKAKAIHVDNNCGAAELLRVYGQLKVTFPSLLIVDLQSGDVHDAASFQQWWSRPL